MYENQCQSAGERKKSAGARRLKIEPVIAGAVVFDERIVCGMAAAQLTNPLVGLSRSLNFGLVQTPGSISPGIVQRLDDKGLLVGEGVLLISNHGRSETRTENKPDSFRSKPVIATAKGGIERSFIERDLSD
jgi:hypothetical protein